MSPGDSRFQVGHRLRSARLQRGLSQGTVARRAGIAPSYLSRVETESVQPTFRTVLRIQQALKADVVELLGQEPEQRDGACPVSTSGHCMLDLVRSETDALRAADGEYYTPREIRLLRRLAAWMKAVRPDRLRAMEILLEDLRKAEPKPSTDTDTRSKTSRRAAQR